MKDPFVMTIEDLMETTAQKAAEASQAADQLEEAWQLGAFLGLSMAKSVYLSMSPRMVDNNGKA